MGAQEDVMGMAAVVSTLIIFVTIVYYGVQYFSDISTMGMTNNFAIRSDVIASSMSLINMHSHSEVNLSWDYLPFSIGVFEGDINGGIGMFFPTKTSTFSSYPLTVPFSTSQLIEENIHYLSSNSVSKFCFKNLGTPEVNLK